MKTLNSIIRVLPIFGTLVACNSGLGLPDGTLYSSEEFTVTRDSVIQGKYVAKAVSDYVLTTNYESPEQGGVSSLMHFRLSINSRDNELPPGHDHVVIVGADTTFTFGECVEKADSIIMSRAARLGNDTQWKLRVDMTPVLNSFKEKGYYVGAGNDTIYADDFKGVWVAGSVVPLTWDFENLYGKHDRKLMPSGDSGIYEVTLTLNPKTETPADPTGWSIDGPVSGMPEYKSNQPLVNALYNMAASEIKSNIRPDSTYRAGREWDGVWTRDVSYSIYLGLAFTDPYGAWRSLKAKLKESPKGKVIVQDTGTGGSWPVSSDRVVWAMAAWEIYMATGDEKILREAYEVVDNTLRDDMLVVWNPDYELMHGEQSYLDWREQTYPKWMQPKDIYESMCLGTNVMFAQAFKVRNAMAAQLRIKSEEEMMRMDSVISNSINAHLWMDNLGYFSEYLYGGVYPIQSAATDNLGQALSIIFDVVDDERAASIISNTPYTPYGISSVYPQLPDIKPYHNNAVWPFVQAYWNIASAKAGNMVSFEKGLAAMMRAAAMFATHKELYVADNGDYRGTAVNSDAQLWSCTGFASMIYRVIMGMSFQNEGMRFAPFVPEFFSGIKTLSGIHYRDANVTVNVEGTGTTIARFAINGVESDQHVLPCDIKGDVTIDITMANNILRGTTINNQPQKWMPRTPIVNWTTDTCYTIANHTADVCYDVFVNSNILEQTCESFASYLPPQGFSLLDIVPVEDEHYQGFTCRPHEYISESGLQLIDASELGVPTGTKLIANKATAAKFVETTSKLNTDIAFNIDADQDGDYFIDVRYANGSGPINTENKCAIRILYVNDIVAGAIVMPQRGTDEWLSTGYSNMLPIRLKKGVNRMNLRLEVPNMNIDGVNTALIRQIRVIKK